MLVTEMLLSILSVCSEEELEASSSEDDDLAGERHAAASNAIRHRRQVIKDKILAVGKMQRIFQLLRYFVFLCATLWVFIC
jgi:serine/threonine-protein phosphatase 2B catalytic subunit